jgi:hypothetical protein
MKTIKVLYDNKTDFIVDIVNKFSKEAYIEIYNFDKSKKRGSIRKMQEEHGSKNFPLIIFQDENLENIMAIWSEHYPDWEKEIENNLKILI